MVNLVTQKPIDDMVSELRRGRVISKEQILRESESLHLDFGGIDVLMKLVRAKAEDPDEIVATSSVLSLKDPVAYTRIVTPCRGIGCNHNQCFDAASYLQLQEQAPTWTCPICNKPAPWENLALDQYVNDILNSTPRDVEAVTIEPDGRWHIQMEGESSNRTSNPTPSDDDDDDDDDEDLVEIARERRPKVEKMLTPHTPLSSREESTAPSASRSSNKRPHNVIDLTLSDDEDDAPAPKAARASNHSSDPSSRTRPSSDRYYFQLPPPPPSQSSYNFDRFNPSF